ncbi:MAG: choice-of-anchor Q domain-containing protein [Tahibacter sp.]
MPARRVDDSPLTATQCLPSRFAIVLALGLWVIPSAAFADVTYTVNSTLDQVDADLTDGVCATAADLCTLRAAVMQANVVLGNAVVIVLPAGTYTLTRPPVGSGGPENGDLNIANNSPGAVSTSIVGAGSASTIVDGNHTDRVFNTLGVVILRGLTIRNGQRSDFGAFGGGILTTNDLTLDDVVIRDNMASYGGGLYNNGFLAVSNATFATNSAGISGGALYGAAGTSVTLDDSRLINNHSGSSAGAMEVLNIGLVRRSSVSGNTAVGLGGGFVTTGFLEIRSSTVSSNAADSGGGIYAAGNLTLVNSTIANNTAKVNGGGIYHVNSHKSEVFNSTIVDNDADHDQDFSGIGGGVYVSGNGPDTFNLYNSVIARNTVSFFPIDDDCAGPGPVVSHGRNLIGSTDGCTLTTASGTWSLLNSPALLGPLQFNGGRTQTIALLPGSNAIDAVTAGCVDASTAAIAQDQRGYRRVTGSRCDAGAFEFDADRIFLEGFQ